MKKIIIVILYFVFSLIAYEKGSGGPDNFGYVWKDSDSAGGPSYSWVEISGTGTALNLSDDQLSSGLSIGFSFPFYSDSYSTVYVCSNGYLTFTNSFASSNNQQFPSITTPDNVIGAYWKNLNPAIQGNIYYYYDSSNQRFIVQYENIVDHGTSNANTFQIILYPDSRIVYQYKTMNGTLTSCAVGIENNNASYGTSVAYNQTYLKSSLAVQLSAVKAGDFGISPSSLSYGTLQLGSDSLRTFTISNSSATEIMEGTITTISGYTVAEAVKNNKIPRGKNILNFKILQNSSKNYNLIFDPPVKGIYNGNVTISTTDPQNPTAGLSVSGSCVAPDISLNGLDTLRSEAYPSDTSQEIFLIKNNDSGMLNYSMSVNFEGSKDFKGSGGPDSYGYSWKDSDDPEGPAYSWVEISGIGTSLTGLYDEYVSGPIDIGFGFNFYGNNFNSVRICENGYISFTSDESNYFNSPIPDTGNPNNLLAALWSDMDTGSGGNIYYYSDTANNRFIVQYEEIYPFDHYDPEHTHTFQVILYSNGHIVYQYKKAGSYLDYYTTGIENSAGTVGSQVVYNAAYLKNNLAIEFKTSIQWMVLSQYSGAVNGSSQDSITASFSTAGLSIGDHKANITVTSNDPDSPSVILPVIFSVTSIPVPTLLSPGDIGLTADLTPTFDWGDVANATSYTILVDNNSNFSSPEISQTTTLSTYTPASNMVTGTYYWKVRTNSSASSGEFSSPWSVELGNLPSAPTLVSPATWSYLTDYTPTLDWADASGATSYTLLVGNADFSIIEIDTTVSVSTFTPGTNLAAGGHYWKVLSNNKFGSSAYSTRWYFILGNIPAVPTLSSPANASSTTDLTPTFDWADVSGANSYMILVDNNSDFSSPEITQSPTASTYIPGVDLTAATYYWKVLATNNFGSSVYSSAWNVRLYIVPAVPANVTTSVVSGNIYINWDDSASATSYDVYSSTTPYGTYSLLTNVAVSEYTYTSVAGNTKMFFYIVAKNSTKESPATIEVFEER